MRSWCPSARVLYHTTHRSSSWMWLPTAKKSKPKSGCKISTPSTAASLGGVHQNNKPASDLWLFSIPQHEIVLSLCRTTWVREAMLVACPVSSQSSWQLVLFPRAGEKTKKVEQVLGIFTNNADPPILTELSIAISKWGCENFCLLHYSHHFGVKQVRKSVKQRHKEIYFYLLLPTGLYFKRL